MQVGVIGFGYWGPNLVRNFMAVPGCTVTYVADSRSERLANLSKTWPGIKTTTDAIELIQSTSVDAVVIATPVLVITR